MSEDAEVLKVALFPIPNVVAFPGTKLPLHVFEPRYRRLIQDCVRENMMVGVSHTGKTIHEPAPKATLEEALSSNQATYQPREVFSAGPVEVIETLDDGRIIVEVSMQHRLELIEELQSLPYRIVSCRILEDDAATSETGVELQRLVHDKLITLVGSENPELAARLEDPSWTDLSPEAYSYRIFQVLRFDADLMQTMLENTSAAGRLEMVWDLLRRA